MLQMHKQLLLSYQIQHIVFILGFHISYLFLFLPVVSGAHHFDVLWA